MESRKGIGCFQSSCSPAEAAVCVKRKHSTGREIKWSSLNDISSHWKLKNSWILSLFWALFIWFGFENKNVGIKYDAVIVVTAFDLNRNGMLTRKSTNKIQGI